MKSSQIIFIIKLTALIFFLSANERLYATENRPNIILLLIDDLGYGDVSAFGCPDVPTPNLDRIVNQGVKFEYAYTLTSVCTPSRSGIMTGMYPQRFGVHGVSDRGQPIPEDHPTMAEMLRDAGYETGMVGRWDMGSFEQGPLQRGFMKVARRSFLSKNHPLQAMSDYPTTFYQKDAVYWTERQADEMVEFISQKRTDPFFLYFAPLAVHSPVEEVPPHYLEPFDHIPEGPRRFLAGTIHALDIAVGKILDAVEASGLDEETLIIFTSDNGGNEYTDGARNLPAKGGKSTPWDGGFRVPTAFLWKGVLPAGKTYNELISLLDIYATAAALSGSQLPDRSEGVDLMPYLLGTQKGRPHESIFFSWIERSSVTPTHITKDAEAVRSGPWRLVRTKKDRKKWRLFDILNDPAEEKNIAEDHPEVVQKLASEFYQWSKNNVTNPIPSARGGKCPRGIGWATPENP